MTTPQDSEEFYEHNAADVDQDADQQSDSEGPTGVCQDRVATGDLQSEMLQVDDDADPSVNSTSGVRLGYMAETLSDINDYVETTDSLDSSYHQLISEMQNKLNLLGGKRDEAVVEKLDQDSQQTGNLRTTEDSKSVKEVVEARQQELLELLDQQILDLACFEEDVQGIFGKFPKDSENEEVKALQEKIGTLQINITKKMSELRQYKEDIQGECANKTMEESIVFINNLNDKLTKSVEQMTREINRVQYEVSNFNFMASRGED